MANLGAYVSTFGAAIPGPIYSALLAGVYRTPAVFIEVTGVFTNTVPTDAYRGAGRPEACYVLERLADKAARELGIDRAEIRRRNLIPPGHALQDAHRADLRLRRLSAGLARALELAEYAGFAQPGRRNVGERRRGIGLACYVESSGVAPSRLAGTMGARVGFYESAQVRVARRRVTALVGTHNHGQGHATSCAQILADAPRRTDRAHRDRRGRHRRARRHRNFRARGPWRWAARRSRPPAKIIAKGQ